MSDYPRDKRQDEAPKPDPFRCAHPGCPLSGVFADTVQATDWTRWYCGYHSTEEQRAQSTPELLEDLREVAKLYNGGKRQDRATGYWETRVERIKRLAEAVQRQRGKKFEHAPDYAAIGEEGEDGR